MDIVPFELKLFLGFRLRERQQLGAETGIWKSRLVNVAKVKRKPLLKREQILA
ncbi:MAG: hypothetical protein Rhob2KO_17230 [Rhodopirellula baltica]